MALNFGPPAMTFEALGSLGKTFQDAQAAAQKRTIDQQKQQLLAGLGQGSGDFQKVGLGLIGAGDVQSGVALLGYAQKEKERQLQEEANKTSPFSSSAAPRAPVAPTASLGTPNEVESRFIGGVKQAGLVNPVGLAAVAAYGKAESGFSPNNVNRTWNDPSKSGQPGQAGGILSWRADRLQKLQSFAAQRGEQGNGSPETQAAFLAQEDPTLIPRLNAAKTPQEANQIMANAWRFAGYNREGGENARRLALTQQYAGRFGAGGGQAPATVPLGSAPQPVQVAENEADTQRLEAQMPGYGGQAPVGAGGVYAGVDEGTLNGYLNNPRVPPNLKALVQQELASRQGGGAPVQIAQAPAQPGAPVADAVAPGARPVQGFVVPPGDAGRLPPNDPFPQVTNDQLISVIRNPRSSPGDKALAQQLFASRQAYASETAPEKREQTRLETQKKSLEVQKLERELAGEGGKPMTPEQRAAFNVPDGVPAWIKRNGDPAFGPAGTKIINEGQRAENKFDEELGKEQAKRFSGYIAEGDVAQGRLADIQTLRETSRRLGSQGSSANLKATIGPYAESLGIKVDGLSDIQLYESITNRLAPTLRAPGSGSTSDIEFRGFQRAIGPLSNNPAAREMILDTFEAASRNDIARADIASRLAQKEITRGQAEKELRALPNPLEAFRKFREANPDAVGEAIKEAGRKDAIDKRGPPTITSPEQALKLPSGTEFIDPNGVRRRVP